MNSGGCCGGSRGSSSSGCSSARGSGCGNKGPSGGGCSGPGRCISASNRSGGGPSHSSGPGYHGSSNGSHYNSTPPRSASAERRDREAAERARQAKEEAKRQEAERRRIEAERKREERDRLEKERHERWLAEQEAKRKEAEEAAKTPTQRREERVQQIVATLQQERAQKQARIQQQAMQFSEMRKEKSKLALAECLAKAEKKRNDKHENCLQLLAVQNKEKIASRDAACMQLQAERKERDRVCEASALKLSAERNERAKANEAKAQELRAADKALKEARFQQQAQPHATPIAPVTQCRPSAQQTTQTGLTNNALSTASPASAAGPAVGGLLTAAARGGQLAIDACAKNPACQNNIMGRFLNGLFGAGASANAVSSLNKTQQTNITLALMYGGTHPDTLANLSSVERTAYDRLIADSKDSKFNILPIPWNDPTEGKLVNPVVDRVGELSLSTPDQREEQGASHTGEKGSAPETVIGTTETPIPAGLDSDSLAYLALKGAEAREAAGKLGYNRRIPPQKAPFDSHGQPVFSNGKNYITPDVDSHNVTNGWKMFDHKGERSGTFDQSLNKIKD